MTEKKITKRTVTKQKKFRFDGYLNAYTGLGDFNRDKSLLSSFQRRSKLSDKYLEDLYHESDVAARICDAYPEEMFKQGFYIKTENSEYKDDMDEYLSIENLQAEQPEIHALLMKFDELEAREKFLRAMIWARVFGGSAIFMGIDDGNAQDEPVDFDRIQDVTFLKVVDSRYVYPWEVYEDPNHPKFNEPKTYRIVPNDNRVFLPSNTPVAEAIVHESRIITFNGTRTTETRMRENRGWSDSILQKCDEVLMQFGQSWQATSHLMTDAAQGIFKMTGLVEALEQSKLSYITQRLADMDMNRSVARMLVVDADTNEDFRRDTYSFNGIPQILELMMLRLSLAARIPVTILMGQSPSGMNATGESDIRWWYDTVKTGQRHELKPKLERLIQLLFLSKQGPTKGKEPEMWSVCFPSPWQMNDFERAQINQIRAETKKTLAEAERLESGQSSSDQLERENTAIQKEANGTASEESENEEIT